MGATAGIAGASGYAGAELLRLLDAHPFFDVAWIGAHTAAEKDILDVAPGMHSRAGEQFNPTDAASIPDLDLIFMALPSGAAMELVDALDGRGMKMVDLGADFRFDDPETYANWYSRDHISPGSLRDWTYGLPEMERKSIVDASRVANPGCYSTAALLALLPLAEAGLLAGSSIFIDGKSGVSGAGRGLAQHLHFAEVFEDVAPYGLGGHRHLPEITQGLAKAGKDGLTAETTTVTFVPHLMPMSRGLLDTCYVNLSEPLTSGEIDDLYDAAFSGEPFVSVVKRAPHTKAVRGSNMALVSANVYPGSGDDAPSAVVMCAIDNLVKGAAGQAIQNANLMFGIPEVTGLEMTGLWP